MTAESANAMNRTVGAASKAMPSRFRMRTALLFRTLIGLGLAYACGFGLFILFLPAAPVKAVEPADGIVVLTGEASRLKPAFGLLKSGLGKRLLITGVNRRLRRGRLKTLVNGDRVFDCCTDLGFRARDTRGNAEEAAAWAKNRGYRSLIVVTADYHMPRSLREFAAVMPSVRLTAYPVRTDGALAHGWASLKRLHGEYVKYLASLVRTTIVDPVAAA